MSRLSKNEFVPAAEDLVAGEQLHINHEGCEAGLDTKRRLYIRRTDDGALIAFCHHCGKSGYHRENERTYRTIEAIFGSTTKHTCRSVFLPRDSTGVLSEWPAKAKVWVYRYGITDEEVARYGLVYSNSIGRVLLPVYSDGTLVGYSARRIFDDGKEKYLTKTSDPRRMVWYHHNDIHSSAVVLCEDILSAIRIGRFVSSCALLGTNLKDEVLHSLVKKHNEFIIFLDDDNRQVMLSQIALKRKLELFGQVRMVKSGGKDPKECTDDELKELLL